MYTSESHLVRILYSTLPLYGNCCVLCCAELWAADKCVTDEYAFIPFGAYIYYICIYIFILYIHIDPYNSPISKCSQTQTAIYIDNNIPKCRRARVCVHVLVDICEIFNGELYSRKSCNFISGGLGIHTRIAQWLTIPNRVFFSFQACKAISLANCEYMYRVQCESENEKKGVFFRWAIASDSCFSSTQNNTKIQLRQP